MGKDKTPSFILELPLRVGKENERVVMTRLEVARLTFNACLGEAQRRWELVHQSKAYQEAKAMPHGTEAERVARGKAFGEARKAHGFSDFSLQMYALELCRSWLGGHLDTFQFGSPPSSPDAGDTAAARGGRTSGRGPLRLLWG